jgi:hypothetical protein
MVRHAASIAAALPVDASGGRGRGRDQSGPRSPSFPKPIDPNDKGGDRDQHVTRG